MKKIYSVCWNITENCNEKCEFCYRTVVDDLGLRYKRNGHDILANHSGLTEDEVDVPLILTK